MTALSVAVEGMQAEKRALGRAEALISGRRWISEPPLCVNGKTVMRGRVMVTVEAWEGRRLGIRV